jgi:sec-independent protein translocase protein TatA
MSPVLAILESPVQLMIVAFIALMLFGKRLPEVMRSLGKGVTEFKKGMHGLEEELTRSSHDSNTYHEPARSLPPAQPQQEPIAPKFLPPSTVTVEAQATTTSTDHA